MLEPFVDELRGELQYLPAAEPHRPALFDSCRGLRHRQSQRSRGDLPPLGARVPDASREAARAAAVALHDSFARELGEAVEELLGASRRRMRSRRRWIGLLDGNLDLAWLDPDARSRPAPADRPPHPREARRRPGDRGARARTQAPKGIDGSPSALRRQPCRAWLPVRLPFRPATTVVRCSPSRASRPRRTDRPASLGEERAILARARRENFPVALRLLPRTERRHLIAIYGFARLSDDLAGEADGNRVALLDALERELSTAGLAGALATRRSCGSSRRSRQAGLPVDPFRKLLAAGRQDQKVTGYATWEELRAYCALSAGPDRRARPARARRGELPRRLARSASVCTAPARRALPGRRRGLPPGASVSPGGGPRRARLSSRRAGTRGGVERAPRGDGSSRWKGTAPPRRR